MNVRLAAETISNSSANALTQLHNDGYEGFENAETTSEFMRNFNDGFDVLNFAKNKKSDEKD